MPLCVTCLVLDEDVAVQIYTDDVPGVEDLERHLVPEEESFHLVIVFSHQVEAVRLSPSNQVTRNCHSNLLTMSSWQDLPARLLQLVLSSQQCHSHLDWNPSPTPLLVQVHGHHQGG